MGCLSNKWSRFEWTLSFFWHRTVSSVKPDPLDPHSQDSYVLLRYRDSSFRFLFFGRRL